MNEVFDKHASFKNVSKHQLKLKVQTLISAAIHKSILTKNYLF